MLACCIFNTRAGSLCQGSSVLLRASKTAEQKVSTFAFRATSSSLAHSAGKGSLCGCVELSLRLTCFWLLPKLGKIKKKQIKNSIKDKIDLLHVSPVKGINFQKQPANPPLALEVTSFLHKTFITLPLKMISEDDPDMKIRNQPESISLPVWCQLPPLRLFIYPGSGLSLCL